MLRFKVFSENLDYVTHNRCEIKIRLGESGVKLEFRRLKLGSLVDGKCERNAFLKIIDGGAGVMEDFGRYCGEAEQGLARHYQAICLK